MNLTLFLCACIGLCCGSLLTNYTDDSRILSGKDAILGQFNFAAAIFKQQKYKCSGAIISERFILTAGHCAYEKDPDDYFVLVGTVSKLEGGYIHEVSRIFAHELYGVYGYDIGLIELKIPIDFTTPYVAPISLRKEYFDDIRNMTLVAWGRNETESHSLPVLQYSVVPTVQLKECKRIFHKVTELNFCTSSENFTGTCKGDSGGPLLDGDAVAGIVSRGSTHCGDGKPNIQVRVSSHLKWIMDNANIS